MTKTLSADHKSKISASLKRFYADPVKHARWYDAWLTKKVEQMDQPKPSPVSSIRWYQQVRNRLNEFWRPIFAWSLIAAFWTNGIIVPLQTGKGIDLAVLITVCASLLPLAVLRSYEKGKGVHAR